MSKPTIGEHHLLLILVAVTRAFTVGVDTKIDNKYFLITSTVRVVFTTMTSDDGACAQRSFRVYALGPLDIVCYHVVF